MSPVPPPRAPYALEPALFPFPHLAALAGRGGMGGPREVALAWLVVARLVRDAALANGLLSDDQRRSRAAGARLWLGSAALPTPVRNVMIRLAESTADGDVRVMAAALDGVMAVTANHLDQGARLELGRLAQAIVA